MPKWQRVQQPWRNWDTAALRRNLGVYVHIPFCLARCGYCDFLTYGRRRPPGLDYAPYHVSLLEEIRRRGEWARGYYGRAGRRVDTVFFGGGTPTSQAPELLCEQVRSVLESFDATQDAEVTVEANPDTLTPGYIDALATAGVNRLSVGIQSTHPLTLRFMGRTHRWADIQPMLAYLQHGPIRRLSFDLIYGVPGQSAARVAESARRLLEYGVEHISAYELTREAGTPYDRWAAMFPGQLTAPEEVIRQRRAFARVLAGHGFYRYEVSNYARPGAECRHNLRYWQGGDYLGLGLGAASRIGTEVINNPRYFAEYRTGAAAAGTEDDPLAAAAPEQCAKTTPPADDFLRLRTRLGLEDYHGDCTAVADWVRRGWVRRTGGRLEVTARGLDFSDWLAREL